MYGMVLNEHKYICTLHSITTSEAAMVAVTVATMAMSIIVSNEQRLFRNFNWIYKGKCNDDDDDK